MPKGRSIKKKTNVDSWLFECERVSDDNDLEDEYINNNNNDEDLDVKQSGSKIDHNNLPHPFYHFKDTKLGRKRVNQAEQITLNNGKPKIDNKTKNFMRSILGIDV